MHVISKKRLREFWERSPEAETPLCAWYRVAEHATWEQFADIRETYPRADQVGDCTVFDIGGNKVRLVVIVRFAYGKVFIRHVMSHEEYTSGKWKEGC